jgi:hypothetical protein
VGGVSLSELEFLEWSWGRDLAIAVSRRASSRVWVLVGLPRPLVGDEAAVSTDAEAREEGSILPIKVQRFLFGPVVDGESAVSLGLAESAVSSFVRPASEECRL